MTNQEFFRHIANYTEGKGLPKLEGEKLYKFIDLCFRYLKTDLIENIIKYLQ